MKENGCLWLVIIVLVGVICYLLGKSDFGDKIQPQMRGSADVAGRVVGVAADKARTSARCRPDKKPQIDNRGSLAEEERNRRLESWIRDRPRYANALREYRNMLHYYLDGENANGYIYDSLAAQGAKSALDELERAVVNDSFENAKELFDEADKSMQRFKASCRWRSGRSKGPGTHMISGAREGSWTLESGYVMYNGRPARVTICGKCGGRGGWNANKCCERCNGQGRVFNSSYDASRFAGAAGRQMSGMGGFAGLIGGFASEMSRNVPQYVTCPGCNGRGQVQAYEQCGYCSGQGKIYE